MPRQPKPLEKPVLSRLEAGEYDWLKSRAKKNGRALGREVQQLIRDAMEAEHVP